MYTRLQSGMASLAMAALATMPYSSTSREASSTLLFTYSMDAW